MMKTSLANYLIKSLNNADSCVVTGFRDRSEIDRQLNS